jgi:DsbC/DsbD-like thiol-disulfide interchange protein
MSALVPLRALVAVIALSGIDGALSRTFAQDASAWVKDDHSSLRLLAGSRSGPVLMGGIEIQLQQGWKTYWRYPGDSGVPPRFDFSKSENVESVTPLFPAPKTFPDGSGGTSFGYHKQLILPLRIIPKNPNEPVLLRANIDYAICEKLCLPIEAQAELRFSSSVSAQDSAIINALGKVPKPVSTSDAAPISLKGFKRDGKIVTVELATGNAAGLELFAEGPTPDWALPVPKRSAPGETGIVSFTFDLDGVPSGAQPEGAALKLTVVGSEGAFEYNVRLN